MNEHGRKKRKLSPTLFKNIRNVRVLRESSGEFIVDVNMEIIYTNEKWEVYRLACAPALLR